MTKVVPSSSSALRNSTAPSRVAGWSPTTPSSRSTRSEPAAVARRAPTSQRAPGTVDPGAHPVASSPRGGRGKRLEEFGRSNGGVELAPPRPRPRTSPCILPSRADEEHPRLAREIPLAHPAVVRRLRRVVVLVDLDVDEADAATRRACGALRSTTSTTGPQVRLVQYFGVAKATTNGFLRGERLGDRDAVELRVGLRRGRQLPSASRSRASASSTRRPRAPTSGASVTVLTTTLPTAWILRPPTGSASTQYLPGLSSFEVRDEDRLYARPAPVARSGPRSARTSRSSGERLRLQARFASQTFAVGRVTTRPWPSMTRNVNRTDRGRSRPCPATIATSSPGARQSASSVCRPTLVRCRRRAFGSSCAEEEPPQPAAIKQAARASSRGVAHTASLATPTGSSARPTS